jgi:hypothetical protein
LSVQGVGPDQYCKEKKKKEICNHKNQWFWKIKSEHDLKNIFIARGSGSRL